MFDDAVTRRRVGGAAWGFGLVLALGWSASGPRDRGGVGYGFAPPVEVAAAETARLLDLPVALHQRVGADDVVARLDASLLAAERARALAQLPAAMDDARRFADGVDERLADRATVAAQLAEDEAELATLRERRAQEEALVAAGASSSQALADWDAQIRVVEARSRANRQALDLASAAASRARERAEALPDGGPWAVEQVDLDLRLLDLRMDGYDLRAWLDGEVSWIYRRPGEVIAAGQPILQVRPVATREVVAYFAPSQLVGLSAGAPARIRRSTGEVLDGHLVSVGAGPQSVPAALWSQPNWPEYGVPVRVRVEGEVGPDEVVTVHL